MKIGIVGQGFVGTAVREGLKQYYEIDTYDIKDKNDSTYMNVLVLESDVIFVCVPTPMKKDGSCDTSIVESVVNEIDEISYDDYVIESGHKTVVIKSTIPPGTTERLNQLYLIQSFLQKLTL